MTGDLKLSLQLMRTPDPAAMPIAQPTKVRELLLFAASEENLELRQRLGTALGSP